MPTPPPPPAAPAWNAHLDFCICLHPYSIHNKIKQRPFRGWACDVCDSCTVFRRSTFPAPPPPPPLDYDSEDGVAVEIVLDSATRTYSAKCPEPTCGASIGATTEAGIDLAVIEHLNDAHRQPANS